MTLQGLTIYNFLSLQFTQMDFSPRLQNLCFLTISIILFFGSCDSKRFYEENKSIEKSVWHSSNKVMFNIMINDISSSYSFFLNIRNTGDYPFSNLFLFMKTTYPDGRITRDTIECTLADNEGKWLGSGVSDIKFNRLLFHKGVRFPQKGNYGFELVQGMRISDVKGISDIGIRLEKE